MKHPRLARALAWTGVLLVLAAVFAAYTRPDFMLNLANQLWSCF